MMTHDPFSRNGLSETGGLSDGGLSVAWRWTIFAVAAAAIIFHPELVTEAVAQSLTGERDTKVFDEGDAVINTFNKKIINWVRGAGIASFAVCGLLWIGTGRANWRWLAGAGGGLFVAGAATPIVKFFMGSSATADPLSSVLN
jgi:hypothetical protein